MNKQINIIVLDESIFETNDKNLNSFRETNYNSFLNFKEWFLTEKLKNQQNILLTFLLDEYIHPNRIRTFVKLYLEEVQVEKEVYITTMNPDIIEYFDYAKEENEEIKIKYFVAFKKKQYELKDYTNEINEVYKVLVEETNEYFFKRMENDVFGEKNK